MMKNIMEWPSGFYYYFILIPQKVLILNLLWKRKMQVEI
jgi:hypothetical protein